MNDDRNDVQGKQYKRVIEKSREKMGVFTYAVFLEIIHVC